MYQIEKIESDKYSIAKVMENGVILNYVEGSKLKILEVAIELKLQKASIVFKMLDTIGHNVAVWAVDGSFLNTSSTWFDKCGIYLN